jgi:hypothetical protein
MSLTAGRRTRAVIAWNNDPAYEFYEDQPSADLNVAVLDPSGNAVLDAYGNAVASASWDNTFEMVDFIPALTGDYTLRVTAGRCDLSPRYLGWAWWRAG